MKNKPRSPDKDLVAVFEGLNLFDSTSVELCAVPAFQILNKETIALAAESSVVPGNPVAVDHDRASAVSPDDCLPRGEVEVRPAFVGCPLKYRHHCPLSPADYCRQKGPAEKRTPVRNNPNGR